VIEFESLPDLEQEIRELLSRDRLKLSDQAATFLKGMLELVEVAKTEKNPIVFV
jgi:hypothetical protein